VERRIEEAKEAEAEAMETTEEEREETEETEETEANEETRRPRIETQTKSEIGCPPCQTPCRSGKQMTRLQTS
jgi:hypothetical protein